MKVRKQNTSSEDRYNIVLMRNDTVTVDADKAGNMFFVAKSPDMAGKLFTGDALEAAAALSFLPTSGSYADLWSLGLPDNSTYDASAALYWLTGGDMAWKGGTYSAEWKSMDGLYVTEFGHKLLERAEKCRTVGALRKMVRKHYSPGDMLEFSIANKLIKMNDV